MRYLANMRNLVRQSLKVEGNLVFEQVYNYGHVCESPVASQACLSS